MSPAGMKREQLSKFCLFKLDIKSKVLERKAFISVEMNAQFNYISVALKVQMML